eukprot:3597922-Lingulodinium_polyedra.AAC.2
MRMPPVEDGNWIRRGAQRFAEEARGGRVRSADDRALHAAAAAAGCRSPGTASAVLSCCRCRMAVAATTAIGSELHSQAF